MGHSQMGQKFAEMVVSELASLGKPVHVLANFSKDKSINNLGFSGVELNDGWGQEVHRDSYIFVFGEVAAEVKVFQI